MYEVSVPAVNARVADQPDLGHPKVDSEFKILTWLLSIVGEDDVSTGVSQIW